jgi:alpha-beta hydrolase superfamily lysophospholipase
LAPPDLSQRDPEEVLGFISTMVATWPSGALEAVTGNLELVDGRVHNRLSRNHHRSILHSLWADDPAQLYPAIAVPVHLMVAGSTTSTDVDEAMAGLPDATVSWHPDAHHDIHLQHPQVVTDQLLALLTRVEGRKP